jgi:hypothetical protein
VVSVAVHVAPVANWVTVVEKAVLGVAVPDDAVGVPLVQLRETGTLATGPLGE